MSYKIKPTKIYKVSEERRLKIGNGMRGRKHSKETREKMRKSQLGKKMSLESRKKMSIAKKGELSPTWKGGVTSTNNLLRHSLEMRLWREAVFIRDNWTCVWCGTKSNEIKDENGKYIIIQADHIKSFSNHPELRFAIDNGRTLCKPFHMTTDNYLAKGRWK